MPMGDETVDETTEADRASSTNDLVFAIAHEIGNHLGALRLQAHLLDEDLDPQALALASVEIDGLAGRSGALLALLRPLLSQAATSSGDRESLGDVPAWPSLLAGIGQHYEDEGTRGISLTIEEPAAVDSRAPNTDWLHSLLIALLDATLASLPRTGSVQLRLEATGGEICLAVEDDGPDEDLSRDAALRGRPLIIALARALLVLVGGRVETSRVEGGTRVGIVFSRGPQGDPD